jgi:hypothetical protein
MQQWEYRVIRMNLTRDDMLNQMGTQGWELVAVDWGSGLAVFKRPKS